MDHDYRYNDYAVNETYRSRGYRYATVGMDGLAAADSGALMRQSVILLLASLLAEPSEQPPAVEVTPPSLKTQLETYFRAPKANDRAKLAAQIAEGHLLKEIVDELPSLELWPAQQKGFEQHLTGEWKIELPSGQSVNASFTLPREYDPTKPVPLVVEFATPNEVPPSERATSIGAWVVLKSVGASFHQPVNGAGDLSAALREIRRRVRVDVDRVFLYGQRTGADAAWVAAMMYPQEFACVIAISGYPRLPYPEQSYALLLPNLRGTPFLSIWTDDPTGQDSVSVVNKAIADFALAAGLHFESATLAPNKSGKSSIPSRVIESATAKKRLPQASVGKWFRYLPQGNAGWLRATDLGGDIWNDEQISIAVTAKEDRDEFVTETLKEKLFFISGKIEGQTITVETKRIAAIELRLSPEQVDLMQPVILIINGRQRFDGLLEPSIKDLLELAYEDWDFQHPVYVRKTFTINAKP